MKNLFVSLLIFAAATCAAQAQISLGGNYTLDQSIVASGGGTSAGSTFKVEGTAGQAAAGTKQQNSALTFQPGFWTAAAPLAPTAASVNLGGRVTTATGRGIRNVRIILSMPNGETRYAITNTFGYYRFADIAAGETYILTAYAKRFVFSSPTQVITVMEEREDVNFTAYD